MRIERRVRLVSITMDKFIDLTIHLPSNYWLSPLMMSKRIRIWFPDLPEDAILLGFDRDLYTRDINMVIHSKAFSKVKKNKLMPHFGANQCP